MNFILIMNTHTCTVDLMKRKILEIELKKMGWWFVRHGGKHDIWTNGDRYEPIPRHNEINEKLSRSILRKAQKGTKS